jgi:hypothetical protein
MQLDASIVITLDVPDAFAPASGAQPATARKPLAGQKSHD